MWRFNSEALAEALKEKRARSQLSHKQFAEKVGTPTVNIAQAEKGIARLSRFCRFCDWLNVNPNALLRINNLDVGRVRDSVVLAARRKRGDHTIAETIKGTKLSEADFSKSMNNHYQDLELAIMLCRLADVDFSEMFVCS